MNLQEALKAAGADQAITRKAWEGSGLTVQPREVSVTEYFFVKANGDESPFTPGTLEKRATDWEVAETNPDLEDPVTYSDEEAAAQVEKPLTAKEIKELTGGITAKAMEKLVKEEA